MKKGNEVTQIQPRNRFLKSPQYPKIETSENNESDVRMTLKKNEVEVSTNVKNSRAKTKKTLSPALNS